MVPRWARGHALVEAPAAINVTPTTRIVVTTAPHRSSVSSASYRPVGMPEASRRSTSVGRAASRRSLWVGRLVGHGVGDVEGLQVAGIATEGFDHGDEVECHQSEEGVVGVAGCAG